MRFGGARAAAGLRHDIQQGLLCGHQAAHGLAGQVREVERRKRIQHLHCVTRGLEVYRDLLCGDFQQLFLGVDECLGRLPREFQDLGLLAGLLAVGAGSVSGLLRDHVQKFFLVAYEILHTVARQFR
jgi:hypothetical protein